MTPPPDPVPPPHLSVVIPSHDTRALTLACLDSLRAAELGGVEVLLIDDGGSDGTAEAVAAGYPEVRLIKLAPAAGFTRAANRGLAAARGGVLLLLNSDTEVNREGLLAVLDRFDLAPGVGVIGAALHYPDGTPQWSGGAEPGLLWLFALASGLPALLARFPLYRRLRPARGTGHLPPGHRPEPSPGKRPPAAALEPPPALRVAWVTGAAMAVRRAAWEAAGALDDGFRFYAQDLELCLRLRRRGWGVEVLPAFRVLHHHGATISRHPPEAPATGATAARQDPELLWTDLLRWARLAHGGSWADQAARALAWGARLRLLGRALGGLGLIGRRGADRRAAWQNDSAAYRRALAAVRAARRRLAIERSSG